MLHKFILIFFFVLPLGAADYPETYPRPPVSDVNPRQQTYPRSCGMRREGYSYCYQSDIPDVVDSFFLTNDGTNKVVTRPFQPLLGYPERWFEFSYSYRARQDLFFSVSDMVSEKSEDNRESYFMIFPRLVLPSIKARGKRLVVTLPDKDVIEFDRKTGEITGGVFEEKGPLRQDAYPSLVYKGKHTLIRVNKTGEDPRIGTLAEIIHARKSCFVPSEMLWEQSGVIHFRFPDDTAFEKFIAEYCH